jgi:alanine-synthesizing transaminase
MYGFRTPDALREAVAANLPQADGYCHQKGIMPARQAVAAAARARGVEGVDAEDVFMGNGVSELILMTMEALLRPGDEVLLPAPDYPLWTAAVALTGATPVYYPCTEDRGFVPDPEEIERLVGPRCRALVLINPNNPTGAVYPAEVVRAIARIAERRGVVLFSDEIYDRIVYDGAVHEPAALHCRETLCATFGGLSKVYRACGLRTGWVTFSGRRDQAAGYLQAVELLASLRLCSSVPGQWAVETALSGDHGASALTAPDGRLGMQRAAVIAGVRRSKHLRLAPPRGALYAFIGVDTPGFDDAVFAMALLERERVLVVPGSSFNIDDRTHFRVTLLPDVDTMDEVFRRIERLLDA